VRTFKDIRLALEHSENNPVWKTMEIDSIQWHWIQYEDYVSKGLNHVARRHLLLLIQLLNGRILKRHCE